MSYNPGLLFLSKNNKSGNYVPPNSGKHIEGLHAAFDLQFKRHRTFLRKFLVSQALTFRNWE